MFTRVISFFLIFVCSIATVIGQQLQLTAYTVNDGLLSNTIRKIFQDRRGNIWVATAEGISKYDGYRFINFSRAEGLPHNVINDMIELGDTLVFACNDGNLAWMWHDKINRVTNPGVVINQFCRMNTGEILAATDRGGIQQFRSGKLYKPQQPFPGANYYSLSKINDSLFIAGSDSSVDILTKDYKLLKCFGNRLMNYGANDVLADSRGRLWTTHLPDPLQLSLDSIVYTPAREVPELREADIQQVFEDNAGNIWFAGMYGLVQFSPDGKIKTIRKKNGLLSDMAVCIFQDREGNLWFGTSLGLCKMPATSHLLTFGEADGLAHPTIKALYFDTAHRLLTVTVKGWQLFDERTEKFSSPVAPLSYPYVIHGQLAFHPPLHTDAGAPMLRNTKAGKAIERFFANHCYPVGISRMAAGRGCYFLSTGWNFYIYDGNKIFEDTSLRISGRQPYTITGLEIDGDGSLWIGTWEEGLLKTEFSVTGNQFRFTKKETILPSMPVRCLMRDREGNIWAGTRNNGVFRFRRTATGKYEKESWDSETGLASNWIHALYEDNKNNVWLIYQDGVDKLINTGTGFRVFNFSRINNLFVNISQVQDAGNNSLWFATFNGLLLMHDGEMENRAPWLVDITEISIGDSAYLRNTMPPSLSYKRNTLRIDFSALTYINEKQVLYSYRLMGSADTNWSPPQNIHSVSFASLQPDEYRFEVRTLGWNEEWGPSTIIPFTVVPPVWQRGWFIVLFFISAAVLLALMVRGRVKRLKHEMEMKQQLAETEMMALRAQMNPHFLFNSLNAIDSLIQTHQHDKATTYLGRFARLLRLVLDSSRNKLVSFDQDFAAMQLYLDMEKFRSMDKFRYEINAEPELLNGGYSIPPLLAQPYIENAIHHGLMNKQGNDRMLTVNASLKDDFIIIIIVDNGVGRQRAAEIRDVNKPVHKSYGWQIAAQRIGLHNGGNGDDYVIIRDLCNGTEATGTSVTLKIKINPVDD